MKRFCLGIAMVALLVSAGQPGSTALHAQAFTSQKLDAALVERITQVGPATPLEVVVAFADPAAASAVRALASRYFQMQALPMAGAILTADQIRAIAAWPEIYSVTLNAPLQYFLAESAPLIGADRVWTDFGETGANTTVAIIDSGIDGTHPDLQTGSKVIQNVKVIPYGLSLENQAITDTSSGHGTHVAGTVGATGAASNGYYRGVAPGVKLVGLGAGEGISILTATQAYDWVLAHHQQYNIRVVSNSWGSTGGDINVRNPIAMATLAAYERGILSVFAAGNDGAYDVMNPYSLPPWVLSVAAGAKDRSLADFSSRGVDGDYFKHPDITAPGVNIYSTRTKTVGITAEDAFPNPIDPLWTPFYAALSGTSMATPHVAGAAALLFSSNPQLSPDEVIDLLTRTATPMPDYALHEAGYGYLDVLAAYQASLSMAGGLETFLAGAQRHTQTEALGFDPGDATAYDEVLFAGVTPIAATEVSPPIEHPFEVPAGTLYVDVRVTWTPQVEDAFDIEIIDPQGRVKMSSGNGVDEPEGALFVPETTGTYILRLIPFASVGTQYEARVKLAYGTPPAGWPPSGTAAHDVYLGVAGVYRDYVAAGLVAEHFRGGDTGFVVFSVAQADGVKLPGHAADLEAVYTDRNGRIVFVDSNILDRDGGEYQSSFDTSTTGWSAGRITVSFIWNGGGTLRAVPTGFFLNDLRVTLATDAASYQPGNTIAFSGKAVQASSVATGTVATAPPGGTIVSVRLLDAWGNRLASTQVRTDLNGTYSGAIVAPATTRGTTTLVAESSFQDPATVLGTKEWYGRVTKTLVFPGNMAPSVSLSVTPEANRSGDNFLVSIVAAAVDPEGHDDIAAISLALKDGTGATVAHWSRSTFSSTDARTLQLDTVFRMLGTPPWQFILTATDSAGNVATTATTLE